MLKHFSPQLIKKCQTVFEKKSGRVVDAEEAEIILEQLAQVGLLMHKVEKDRKQKGGGRRE